jgi:hypothetical protein
LQHPGEPFSQREQGAWANACPAQAMHTTTASDRQVMGILLGLPGETRFLRETGFPVTMAREVQFRQETGLLVTITA